MPRAKESNSTAPPLDPSRELKLASPHAHDRRTRRLAVTFDLRIAGGPCDQLPDQPIPLDSCRLHALSHRWCRDRRGGARPAVAFATPEPGLDPDRTGRIRYDLRRVVDLADPQRTARLERRELRAATLLIRPVVDTDPEELADGFYLPTPLFAFRAEWPTAAEDPGVADDSPNPGVL